VETVGLSIKPSERRCAPVAIQVVQQDDELMLLTAKGQVRRTRVNQISTYSRNTQGVRIMTLDSDEQVVSISRLHVDEDEEDENGENNLIDLDAEQNGELTTAEDNAQTEAEPDNQDDDEINDENDTDSTPE